MTRVYIVRHCETEGNSKRVFQGHCDLPVTHLGEKQLHALSKHFEGITLDAIYCSPLLRTQKTGKAIRGNKDCEPKICEGLIELNGGIYEGKEFSKIYSEYPDFKEIWANHPQNFAPENGERMIDAYERIWKTVLKIAKESKGKTVACATHGGVIRCLLCRLLKDDISKLSDIPFGNNTAVSLIEFDDTFNPTLIFFNNDHHLTDDLKNAAATIPTGDK